MTRLPRSILRGASLLALGSSLSVAMIDATHPMFNDAPLVAVFFAVVAVGHLPFTRRSKAAGLSAIAWLIAAVAWGTSATDRLGPLPARLVVFGVDGATWRVIDQEPLPNLQAAAALGARGDLISMEPMFSPLLWTTIASGRTVNDHGVRGFHVQADDCKVARWWDIAEADGQAVGLYKWLVDYPPREFAHGGFWVPSWLAPASDTWPARLSVVKEVELANRVRRKSIGERAASFGVVKRLVDAGARLSTLTRAGVWRMREAVLSPDDAEKNTEMQLIRGALDRDVFIAQLYQERPTVASLNYYATDGLAHLYWDRYEAGGPELRAAYHQADEIFGELAARMGPEGRLLLVSDHGFQAMTGNGTAGQFLPLTDRLAERIRSEVGTADVTRIGRKLVVGTPSPAEAERVRAWLPSLTDSRGEPFFKIGDYPDDAGSLALTLADEQISADRLASDTVGGEPLGRYVTLTASYTGMHEERGVILAWGAGVPAGTRLGDVPLLDAAPTLLAGAGLPASDQMPGRAHVWPERPRVAEWDSLVPRLHFLGGEDSGVNEEMLKALGYTDDGSGRGNGSGAKTPTP
jgi:hypothetical protein